MKDYLYKELYELENRHWWFVAKKKIVISMVKKYLNNKKDNKILDAGCGSGLMLKALKSFGQVYGMDCSEEAITFSRQVFDGDVRQGSMPGNIPYEKNYFNTILALDVIEHIEDDISALEDLKAHLSDDGVCIITVPAYMFLWSNHDVVHEHKRRYTIGELREKLLKAGLNILKISYYNTLLFPLIFMIRLLKKVFKIDSGSDAVMPNKLVNSILKNVFSLEVNMLNLFNMIFGVSIIAVVKKS